MWKFLARTRLTRVRERSAPITYSDIQSAQRVLFAVFARYGDSIIAFKSINRFMALHPNKDYLIVTTHQALPYAHELIKSPVTVIAINKRRDPFKLIWLMAKLGRLAPDVAFNPWSHGLESEMFISYGKRFYIYGSFDQSCGQLNHYEKLRRYMQLPLPDANAPAKAPGQVRRILLTPFSTDPQRSIDPGKIETLIAELRALHPHAELTIAIMKSERGWVNARLVDRIFVFGKTTAHSVEFLSLMKSIDLFVGVDSGPLHLADALGIPAVAIFGPTAPATVLDHGSRVVPLQMTRLGAGMLSGESSQAVKA